MLEVEEASECQLVIVRKEVRAIVHTGRCAVTRRRLRCDAAHNTRACDRSGPLAT